MRLYTFIALISAYSSQALAIGLGEIQPDSYLGQPFKAQIPVYELGDFTVDQLKVGFASHEEHERLGLEFAYHLRNVRMSLVERGNQAYVELVSREPIVEPYLDFALALRWSNGSVVKNYTVFLDPVSAGKSNHVARVASTQTNRSSAQHQAPLPRSSVNQRMSSAPSPSQSGNTYTVQSGDSLWLIANKLKSSQLSRQVIMDTIFRDNPHAFVGGDKRKLKVGVALALPDNVMALATAEPKPSVAVTNPQPSDNPSENKPLMPAARKESEADLALAEDERERYTKEITDLSVRVETLTDELNQSHQKMTDMQTRMNALIEKYQEVNNREQDMLRKVAQQSSGDGAINRLEASSLHEVNEVKLSVWGHVIYGMIILLMAGWIVKDQWAALRRRFGVSGVNRVTLDEREAQASRPLDTIVSRAEVSTVLQDRRAVEKKQVNVSSEHDKPDVIMTASAYAAFGQYGEAERLLEEAISITPDNSELYLALRQIYRDSGNLVKMQEVEEQLSLRFPNDVNVQKQLN